MTPTAAHRRHYLAQIWHPYHQRIQSELARIKHQFGYALLFDAHSIASVIPRLFDGRLPDLNLGQRRRQLRCSLSDRLVDCCQKQSPFSHVLNGRFKGGYITRIRTA
jgi:formiminoglutamase